MSARLCLWPLLLVSSSLATGCAARGGELGSAATRDERREQIALLDRRIAAAEAELGLTHRPPPASRYAAPPPAPAGGAEAPSGMDGEVDGAMAPGAPAPAQSPMTGPPPVAEEPMSPTQRSPSRDGACARICRSVLSICDASARICRLAEDLDDAWAQGRCEAAERSCDAAERRASSCGC